MNYSCTDCEFESETKQGLGGHRRWRHREGYETKEIKKASDLVSARYRGIWTGFENAEKVGIYGGNDSGKTTALEAIAEHLHQDEHYVIVLDAAGAIHRHLKGGNRRGDGYFDGRGTRRQWIAVEIDKPIKSPQKIVNLLAKLEKDEGEKIYLLDLSPLLSNEQSGTADAIAQALRKAENGVLLVDEIHELAPQRGTSSRELERFIKMSGNLGWYPVIFTTQRVQSADKEVLALAQTHLIAHLDNARDVEYLAKKVVMQDVSEAMNLEQGEFLVRGREETRVRLEIESGIFNREAPAI